MPLVQAKQDSVTDTCRVLVVDDSAVIRGLISNWLKSDPQIEVIGSAADGQKAIIAAQKHKPDIVVLDIEMPNMDGLTALPELLAIRPQPKVIMASTLTRRNADISMRAMAAGASDYVPKPTATHEMTGGSNFKSELLAKVKAIGLRQTGGEGRIKLHRAAPVARNFKAEARTSTTRPETARFRAESKLGQRPQTAATPVPAARPRAASAGAHRKPSAIVIGSSTGGPQALFKLFEALDGKFQVPIFVTQHMPATFTKILAEHIKRAANAECSEAQQGEVVKPGHIYVAPGDYHMVLSRKNGEVTVHLNQEPPVNFCRPSVDPMFDSAADVFGSGLLAVMLTGMGQDGLDGSKKLVSSGGRLIAQDEKSSVVWGMPGAVAQAGLCEEVKPLDEIGPKLVQLLAGA